MRNEQSIFRDRRRGNLYKMKQRSRKDRNFISRKKQSNWTKTTLLEDKHEKMWILEEKDEDNKNEIKK